jgi:hypothetical protein
VNKTWQLLVGFHAKPIKVVLMLFVGAVLAITVLIIGGVENWKSVLLAILAWDIGAGLMSTSNPGLHDAWRQQSRANRWFFVIFHLTVYPAVLIFLSPTLGISVLLVGLLVAKTGFFAAGTLTRRT